MDRSNLMPALVVALFAGCRAETAQLASDARVGGGLSASAAEAETLAAVAVRRVWADSTVDFGHPSPDGRYVSVTDWNTGDLAAHDIISGETRRVTHNPRPYEPGYANGSVFSPDGRSIAYAFNDSISVKLRVIGADGSGMRVVLDNHGEFRYLTPEAWSPDGQLILATIGRPDLSEQIVLIGARDGRLRVLKSFDWREPRNLSFSRDGRFIAYDFPPEERSLSRDVYVVAVDGSRETRVVESAADDQSLGWTPDGQGLLFLSDRAGSPGAWLLPMREGRTAGEPRLVRPDMWHLRPLGFSRNAYFYGVIVEQAGVQVATLDVEAGSVLTPPGPVPVSGDFGSGWADWSPDGQRLAYVIQTRGPQSLVVRSVETGESYELRLDLDHAAGPVRWAPDGRFFVVSGSKQGRVGLYRVDLENGRSSLIVAANPRSSIYSPELSPDRRTLYYARSDIDTSIQGIYARDLATGNERLVYHAPVRWQFALSPDGRQIAIHMKRPHTGYWVELLPAAGGEPRVLYRVRDPRLAGACGVNWTPDGRYLLFLDQRRPEENRTLWRVRVADGEARQIMDPQQWIQIAGSCRNVRLSRDGRHLAFTGGRFRGEVWVMENLPSSTGVRTSAVR